MTSETVYEKLIKREQPINGLRAFLSGVVAASFMLAFIDVFNMLGTTRFSFETYLGSLIRGTEHGARNWVVGLVANWLVGGLFGILYAYCFEYVLLKSSARLGVVLGYFHVMFATIAVFPFFTMVHEFYGFTEYVPFGVLGHKVDPNAPILIFVGHLLFGATMGLFYGPAGLDRLHAQWSEPGDSGLPGESGVILEEDDPEDAAAA